MATKKRTTSKKKSNFKKATETRTQKDVHVERVLVENFVSLQKVITNLSMNFDSLTNQISKLLELFEVSAKSLAEKNVETFKAQEETKEISKKIDNLLDQNKIIARGLTLIHEKNSGPNLEIETMEPEFLSTSKNFEPRPMEPVKRFEAPKPKNFPISSAKDIGFEGYQKSIADI